MYPIVRIGGMVANLSNEDKLFIKEEFSADPTRDNIEFLASKFDVSNRSIIAILTAAGLYKRQGYLSKSGEVPINKEQLVSMIAKAMGTELHMLEGLEKANKSVLKLLLKSLDPVAYNSLKPEQKLS